MNYPQDLNQPGAVEALLAFHRGVFGDARMDEEETTDGGTSTGEAGEAGSETTSTEETKEGDEGKEKEKELTPEQLKAELTRTRAEAANWRTKLRDAEKALKDAKTPEEHAAAIDELSRQNAELEHQILVGRVARKHSLPDELAERLRGATEAELEADAEALKKFAAPQGTKPPVELRGGLTPDEDPDDEDDPRKLAARYPRR